VDHFVLAALRDFRADVGKHTPPDFEALPTFLNRFHSFYGDKQSLEGERLAVIAAAHHRLAWIHPFGDGNGRVIRLQSPAQLKTSNFSAWAGTVKGLKGEAKSR
jgi:Fic family protein